MAAALVTAGCAGSKPPVFEREAFGSTGTYTRAYAAPLGPTCEAARRALLSQGYVIDTASPSEVKGHKSFQPEAEMHIQIAFNVVCAADMPATSAHAAPGGTGRAGATTIAFASAVQDRYALKKSNNSASVGLSVLGSVSLPFTSSDDSLVKVASETIGADDFYRRFFELVGRYLQPGAEAAAGATPARNAGEAAIAATPVQAAAASEAAAASGPASGPGDGLGGEAR